MTEVKRTLQSLEIELQSQLSMVNQTLNQSSDPYNITDDLIDLTAPDPKSRLLLSLSNLTDCFG
jgi:hypothetical protein